ncbi:GNAT family N-acetyltransferase [Actinoplanes sp. G11-F43]|uniref:GNAT family N-acetyltransferase n=1 Tax=Actinoplanes sp. G11-F43 TaxID=3424130 RepID=UPI003D32C19D
MTTERLVLRRFRASDAPVLAAYRSIPEVARYQPWAVPFPVEKAEGAVKAYAEGSPTAAGWFQYAVEHTEDQRLIGDVGVRIHDNLLQAEIGFTFDPAYQRKGLAFEAVGSVLDRLFGKQGLRRVTGECDARNTRSAALMERLGFQREGLLRQQTFIKGEWTDDLLYGLLATEWQRADR